jgi:hypothetical protein
MRQQSLASCLATAIVATTTCTWLGAQVACGGNCSHKPSTVQVVFPGTVPPDDVITFTASGACGPAPLAICQASNASLECDAAMPNAWTVDLPTLSAGECIIHIGLKNGQVFDASVTVKHSSDCGGFDFVDSPVIVSFLSGDAGSSD